MHHRVAAIPCIGEKRVIDCWLGGKTMLTLDECIGWSDLDKDELDAIAEHEHVPLIVATELAANLLKTNRGVYRIHMMFKDNLAIAVERKQLPKIKSIEQAYKRFAAAHPMPRVL
jgi:hypothetical protein